MAKGLHFENSHQGTLRMGENLRVRSLKHDDRRLRNVALGKALTKRKHTASTQSEPCKPSKLAKETLIAKPANEPVKEVECNVDSAAVGVFDECISAAVAPMPPMSSLPKNRRILQLQQEEQDFVHIESSRSYSRIKASPHVVPKLQNIAKKVTTTSSKQKQKKKANKENSNPKTPKKVRTPKKFSRTPKEKKLSSKKGPNLWQLSASKTKSASKTLRNISGGLPAVPIFVDPA